MKKLISELEDGKRFSDEIFNDTPIGKALKEGFEAAYKIVRSHNPWIGVETLPPLLFGGYGSSIEVNVMDLPNEVISVGRYDYGEKRYYSDYENMNITHWSYLPEAKNDNPS